jgi:hypothetical protein
LRTLVIRQDWRTTGQLSGAPDVTDSEAKVARLTRYAELRWSLSTSLLLYQEVLDIMYRISATMQEQSAPHSYGALCWQAKCIVML